MSYDRVIPRDLFNEGNLLKCFGRLYIELEKIGLEDMMFYEPKECGFLVIQNASGDTELLNVGLRDKNITFFRPLNARDSWPLYAISNEEEYSVFDVVGNLTKEFKTLLI